MNRIRQISHNPGEEPDLCERKGKMHAKLLSLLKKDPGFSDKEQIKKILKLGITLQYEEARKRTNNKHIPTHEFISAMKLVAM